MAASETSTKSTQTTPPFCFLSLAQALTRSQFEGILEDPRGILDRTHSSQREEKMVTALNDDSAVKMYFIGVKRYTK